MSWFGLCGRLGDLRISDLDTSFALFTQIDPMESSTFSYGSYL